MNKRSMVKERKSKRSTHASIMDFLKEKEITRKEIDFDSRIEDYLRSMGTVTKSEMYKWCMNMSIAPVILYRTLRILERRGRVRKYFDENREDLVYDYIEEPPSE